VTPVDNQSLEFQAFQKFDFSGFNSLRWMEPVPFNSNFTPKMSVHFLSSMQIYYVFSHNIEDDPA